MQPQTTDTPTPVETERPESEKSMSQKLDKANPIFAEKHSMPQKIHNNPVTSTTVTRPQKPETDTLKTHNVSTKASQLDFPSMTQTITPNT